MQTVSRLPILTATSSATDGGIGAGGGALLSKMRRANKNSFRLWLIVAAFVFVMHPIVGGRTLFAVAGDIVESRDTLVERAVHRFHGSEHSSSVVGASKNVVYSKNTARSSSSSLMFRRNLEDSDPINASSDSSAPSTTMSAPPSSTADDIKQSDTISSDGEDEETNTIAYASVALVAVVPIGLYGASMFLPTRQKKG